MARGCKLGRKKLLNYIGGTMSLKNILTGLGRRILGGKRISTPATGQQQRQITYEPKPSQAQGQELAVREIRNPPVVLKKTKPLQMGDDVAPAFGSSTYDWAMRIGRSSTQLMNG